MNFSLYKETDDIIVNLTVTRRCYARCRGCINNFITFAGENACDADSPDCDPPRDARLVLKITEKYPSQALTLCFYGGEPFLVPEKMEELRYLLEKSPAGRRIRYMVYTTGELIGENIPRYHELICGIWLYSVSIDGSNGQHTLVRPGTDLNKITRSLEQLRGIYKGNILFWSTLREEQSLLDCFNQFLEMHRSGLVNHMFWHWADTREPFTDIESYASRYRQEFSLVLEEYVSYLSTGELLPLSHINELVLYLLTGRERGHTACAVELSQNFDILDGVVHACTDLPASIGAFSRDGGVEIPVEKLHSLVSYKQQLGCHACNAHFYCGGRCPVQALAGSPGRTRQICRLMRLHVDAVKERLLDINRQLQLHNIGFQQLYDRSAFIARYTDVVP